MDLLTTHYLFCKYDSCFHIINCLFSFFLCLDFYLPTYCWFRSYCRFWSHSVTYTHLVGLLWTADRPVAETYAWQHITLTKNKHPCSSRDLKPQYQKPADPFLRKPGHRVQLISRLTTIIILERHCHLQNPPAGMSEGCWYFSVDKNPTRCHFSYSLFLF